MKNNGNLVLICLFQHGTGNHYAFAVRNGNGIVSAGYGKDAVAAVFVPGEVDKGNMQKLSGKGQGNADLAGLCRPCHSRGWEGRGAEEPPKEGLKANPPLEIAIVLASCLEGHVLFASHLRLLYHR